jgi:hypothetical protein
LTLEPGEAPYDLAFAVRVGVLDGRYPEAGERARWRFAAALTAAGQLFIDGGDPREIDLHDHVRRAGMRRTSAHSAKRTSSGDWL